MAAGMRSKAKAMGKLPKPNVRASVLDPTPTGDLCRVDQPRSCPYADRDSAQRIGVAGGAVYEGEEFSQAVKRVHATSETVLGPAFVGTRVLGSNERQCN